MGRNLKRGAQSVNDWNLGSREEANRRQERDHWPFTTGFTWVWAFKLVCMCPLCYTSLKLYPFSNGCTVSVLWLLESWNRSLNSFKTVALMVIACSSVWNFWANAGRTDPTGRKPHPITAFSRPKDYEIGRPNSVRLGMGRWHGTRYRTFWWCSQGDITQGKGTIQTTWGSLSAAMGVSESLCTSRWQQNRSMRTKYLKKAWPMDLRGAGAPRNCARSSTLVQTWHPQEVLSSKFP